MGLLTADQLVAEVLSAHAGRADLTSAQILNALNMAQDVIGKVLRPTELEAVATAPTQIILNQTGIAFTEITPRPRKITSITVVGPEGEARKLTGMSERQFNGAFPNPTEYGPRCPVVYVKFANAIRFYPIPDKTYPIRITMEKQPTALTTGGVASTLDCPDVLLIYWATEYLFNLFGEEEKAVTFRRMFNNGLTTIQETEDKSEPDRLISAETAHLASCGTGPNLPWLDPFVRRSR